ncbi:hypothetical protein [Staphylococcus aureus]
MPTTFGGEPLKLKLTK